MERVLLWLYTLEYPYPVNATPSSEDTPFQETVPPTPFSSSNSKKDIKPQPTSLSNSVDLADSETNRLIIHARVYALADRFDIPELREVATAKFKRYSSYRSPRSDDFVAAALEVLRSTPVNDSGLRPILRHVCATHLDGMRTDCVEERDGCLVDSKSWESIFKEDVDFTWQVITTAAVMHCADLDVLEARMHR